MTGWAREGEKKAGDYILGLFVGLDLIADLQVLDISECHFQINVFECNSVEMYCHSSLHKCTG